MDNTLGTETGAQTTPIELADRGAGGHTGGAGIRRKMVLASTKST